MYNSENIQRWTLKISKDATFEEMQDAIRAASGDPTLTLDKAWFDNFKSLDQIERVKREKLIKLLGPLYKEYFDSDNANTIKRRKEINNILHYIQFAGDDTWKIISIQESPDFIIEVQGEKIGLELTGIYDKDVVAQISLRESVCSKAEIQLRKSNPELNGLINVVFAPDRAKDLPANTMTSGLINYLTGIATGIEQAMPTFIEGVDIKPFKVLQIVLSERYRVKEVDFVAIDHLIAQKENKIATYKENTGLEKIWLLVIIDGVSEKSAPKCAPELLPQRQFAFDKIIVYDTFTQIGMSSQSHKKV